MAIQWQPLLSERKLCRDGDNDDDNDDEESLDKGRLLSMTR